MYINKILPNQKIIFKRKIIDSHIHVGSWNENGKIKDYTKDIDIFIKSNLENGDTIERILVSNLDCMAKDSTNNFLLDEYKGNKKLIDLAKENEKIAPLATCQPKYGNINNINKLFSENQNKFVGLKFHPEQLNLSANNEAYIPYIEFAKKENLPCLFHSGSSEVSNASHIYDLAKKFPEVKFIMAHWGAEESGNYDKVTDIIIESVKTKNSKIYADISWVDCNNSQKPTLKKIITRLKEENALDRILFGSDAPLGRFGGNGENGISPQKAYSDLLDDIKNMIKKEFSKNEAEDIIDKIFYKNSENLFFKKPSNQEPQISAISKKKPNNKTILWLSAIFAVITGFGLILKKQKSNNNIDK